MLIIPAVDIMQGRVVRLHQGDFNKEKFYADDPVEMARIWQEKGASFLHIVDLDGAREGQIKNKDIILRILKSVTIPCQIGGGLREETDIEFLLEQGAKHVVLGTKAIEDVELLKKLISKFDGQIIVSIDFAGDKVVKKGWQEETTLTPVSFISKMQKLGINTIVVTDITRDGTLTGPNMHILKQIIDSVDISIIASGGISNLDDIKRLKEIGGEKLVGVIIGRALYEGKVELEEAIKAAE